MNRRERRAAGFRGPAYTHSVADGRPRFVRRHTHDTLTAMSQGKRTRRVRRAAARIIRAAQKYGKNV